jgi:hypothetical protein
MTEQTDPKQHTKTNTNGNTNKPNIQRTTVLA